MKKLWLTAALLASLALPALAQNSVFTPAGPEGPAQTVHAPAKPGPIVILISGASGPNYYQTIAGDVSRLGYYAVLLDGNDILTRQQDGAGNLRKAIERAQASKQAVPGKVAVIGFSRGGGGALAFATNLPIRTGNTASISTGRIIAGTMKPTPGGAPSKCSRRSIP